MLLAPDPLRFYASRAEIHSQSALPTYAPRKNGARVINGAKTVDRNSWHFVSPCRPRSKLCERPHRRRRVRSCSRPHWSHKYNFKNGLGCPCSHRSRKQIVLLPQHLSSYINRFSINRHISRSASLRIIYLAFVMFTTACKSLFLPLVSPCIPLYCTPPSYDSPPLLLSPSLLRPIFLLSS